MRVSDLMTIEVATARPDESVDDARIRMEAGDFQYLPVVDETGQLVGLVSERDLLRARAAAPAPKLVSEVLTKHVPSIEPDAPAADAVQMMLDFEIDAVPVVANDKVIGILTVTDFLPEMRQLLRDTA